MGVVFLESTSFEKVNHEQLECHDILDMSLDMMDYIMFVVGKITLKLSRCHNIQLLKKSCSKTPTSYGLFIENGPLK